MSFLTQELHILQLFLRSHFPFESLRWLLTKCNCWEICDATANPLHRLPESFSSRHTVYGREHSTRDLQSITYASCKEVGRN